MSAFNIYNNNLVDTATLTASTENALFPASNIQDPRRTKVFRSTTNSDNVVLDFGSAQAVDTIFLLADKRNNFGVTTVTVQFNSTNSWGAPAYSKSMTLTGGLYIAHAEFAQISYRYARIVMTSSLGYCELSKVFIGSATTLSRSIKFGWSFQDEELSQKSANRYGQQFSDVVFRQKKLNFSFAYLDKTDLAVINSILDYSGITKPIWLKIGDSTMIDDYRRTSGAFMLDNIPSITNSHFNKYNLSFSMRELT
jgi:hypothetical protein